MRSRRETSSRGLTSSTSNPAAALGGEPVLHVAAVEPEVVCLEELRRSLPGRHPRTLLDRHAAFAERDLHDRPATGGEHAVQLAHRRRVVANVLEHVEAQHDVRRAVVELERGQVHVTHRPGGLEVDAEVLDRRLGRLRPCERSQSRPLRLPWAGR